MGDEPGPPLGPAPGSARAGAEAKRRGGGEPRGVWGHEATGGGRIGADALLEALNEQRGGSLSATDRGRREGTELRVRVTRKMKQCRKGEVIREGGVKRRRGRGQDPERPPPRAGRGRVGQRCRDDHAIRSREPALGPASPPGPPAPPQTPGGQDATSPGLSHPTCLHLSARDPNGWPGRRSRGLGVPVSFRRGRAPRVWRRRVCRQGLGPLFLRGTEKPARLARPPEILRPAAFGTGFIYSFKSASGIRSSSFSP